ncbi:hypothetical protein Dfri01_46700 [Dyadobacter frigoris]|uniref:Crp/Fnr family transcriptional regulator n=1 Tax=Dyadobacter frigoris TaxID=2576211 RepID=UPI0024A458B6|nr:Crp/Fnr family transcriptional regulator [Dyadobacter frigoris]GLU55209.1 hypothetical protein Dfri01_46700 [Dyadobacter frigoris]
MDDFSNFKKNIARFVTLTPVEEEYLISKVKVTHIRRRQFIVQPEFVCKYKSYIVTGCFRAYLVDSAGHEHTITLSVEDWWISDFNSYFLQEPSELFVEALEDSVLIQMDHVVEDDLLAKIPKLEIYFKVLAMRALAFLQKRILANLSKSAEERYHFFAKKYPHLLQRVPQHMIASYLGMTTQFLSKIRNQPSKT